ncbi:MAG TPA: pyrroloquinoline quinone biosynthesis protein PqqB [Candidatus Limnocylindrales bacterium]|nr:pyrroloquinoline quinone biosynthesis protein PqqB [Candidatus Limnocylindrales bacterium]
MRVKVLGSAAGGGFPQWNCSCANCRGLRAGTLKGRPRTQAQLAVSPAADSWILLNASPDLRQQISGDPEFAPPEKLRTTPIASIILTSADLDCVLGLLHLREFQPLRIYSTPAVRRILREENSFFRALERSQPSVAWENLPLNREISIGQQAPQEKVAILCRAIPLGGDFPDYVSEGLRRSLPKEEAVVGLELAQGEKRLFYVPSLPGCGDDWKKSVASSDVALLDGTFWTDDELSLILGNARTAREIGHLPLSGAGGLLDQLKDIRGPRRILIHLNNTNPALDEESAANRALRDAGWEIAYDGMEFEL